ncbi:MAG: hypothetical protein Tsb0013_20440 [Phycisphaerales bacterium]
MALFVFWTASGALAGDTEVSIDTQDPQVVLAGTLSMPEGEAEDLPGVVLLTGSGPQDRDSTIFGQTPLKVLAEAFVERGYAVLRCDDRGVGASVGSMEGATIDDFVNDARAMVKFLSVQEGVDWKKVFVVGHSEGAGVAAELAASGDVHAGVVFLGGTAVPGHEVLTDQSVRLLEAMGLGERGEAVRTAHRALMEALLDGADEGRVLDLTTELVVAQTGGALPEAFARMQAEQAAGQFEGAWFRSFLEHDPSRAIRKMSVPGLALFGSLDQQVSDELNAGPMADALAAMREPLSRVVVMPGRNHLFQRARTGGLDEYAQLDDLDPDVAEAIADWMDDVLESRDR